MPAPHSIAEKGLARKGLGKQQFLIVTSVVMAMSFAAWLALLNNFVIERAAFTGAEIGILQSLREIPGFLAFTAVFVLLAITEQRFAMVSLCLLTLGVALTGLFPFEYGLYATTILMSVGFHYFETINQSLQLQYLSKEEAPGVMGLLLSYRSAASLLTYGAIWVFINLLSLEYVTIYLLIGGLALLVVLWAWMAFPTFEPQVQQHKSLIVRKRYWLYYLLTFFGGARRQIFMVFAGFMLVEQFGYDVSDIALLYMLNHLLNLYLAPKVGRWIGRVGERRALTVEYLGLMAVFVGYAWVDHPIAAAALFLINHLFFAMAIAIKTYFQKIADPADIAATAGVSFSINHIAAVVIPASFGLLWLEDPSLVFYCGAAIAGFSLCLAQWVNIPVTPASASNPA